MMFATVGSQREQVENDNTAKPFCLCWCKKAPVAWQELSVCTCGEEIDVNEWRWEAPEVTAPSHVVMSDDRKQVTFHPFYSSGTAAVRGDTPMLLNNHYYWEVKMLSEAYGTDIMVGIGTSNVNLPEARYKFTSLLGEDSESYGLSYMGPVKHNAIEMRGSPGFCRGSIIGVRLDMWQGTLEFYLNRQPQGICFYNLRRHQMLFPMVSSTAAQSSMRLIYAASWRASLLVDAAKVLASTVQMDKKIRLPPGLWHTLKSQFWLTLPTEGCVSEESENEPSVKQRLKKVPTVTPSTATSSSYFSKKLKLRNASFLMTRPPRTNGGKKNTEFEAPVPRHEEKALADPAEAHYHDASNRVVTNVVADAMTLRHIR